MQSSGGRDRLDRQGIAEPRLMGGFIRLVTLGNVQSSRPPSIVPYAMMMEPLARCPTATALSGGELVGPGAADANLAAVGVRRPFQVIAICNLHEHQLFFPFPLNYFQPSPPNSHMSRC